MSLKKACAFQQNNEVLSLGTCVVLSVMCCVLLCYVKKEQAAAIAREQKSCQVFLLLSFYSSSTVNPSINHHSIIQSVNTRLHLCYFFNSPRFPSIDRYISHPIMPFFLTRAPFLFLNWSGLVWSGVACPGPGRIC